MDDTELVPSWDKLSTREVFDGFNFSVREDLVQLPSGDELDFEYVSVVHSVAVLGFTESDELILVKEWRQSVERVVEYGLPGGGCHAGESPIEAAEREFREETGFVAGEFKELLTTENNVGVSDGVHTFFVALDCKQVEEAESPDVGEELVIRTEPIEKVYEAVQNGEVSDARTLIPLLYYRLYYE